MVEIHPTAVVDPKAELADGVCIGAYTVIEAQVQIGARTSVGPHCVIQGRTRIGQDNRIWQFCSLGASPQDKKYADEPTELHIGDRNTVREFCTFNRGTAQDAGVTALGDDNWMMAYVHLAHDCHVGDRTIFANNAQIAGHVHVGDWAILGAYTCVHQFVRIGAHALTAMGTVLLRDLPPFVTASGNTARAHGVNAEGLKRRQFSPVRLAAIKRMHRALYRQGHTIEQARAVIAELAVEDDAGDVALMLDFLAQATRGIVR